MKCVPLSATRSCVESPFAENFCLITEMESVGAGRFAASEAEETLPSRRPVGTDQNYSISSCQCKYISTGNDSWARCFKLLFRICYDIKSSEASICSSSPFCR